LLSVLCRYIDDAWRLRVEKMLCCSIRYTRQEEERLFLYARPLRGGRIECARAVVEARSCRGPFKSIHAPVTQDEGRSSHHGTERPLKWAATARLRHWRSLTRAPALDPPSEPSKRGIHRRSPSPARGTGRDSLCGGGAWPSANRCGGGDICSPVGYSRRAGGGYEATTPKPGRRMALDMEDALWGVEMCSAFVTPDNLTIWSLRKCLAPSRRRRRSRNAVGFWTPPKPLTFSRTYIRAVNPSM